MTEPHISDRLTSSMASMVSRRTFLRLASTLITLEWTGTAFAAASQAAGNPNAPGPLEQTNPLTLTVPSSLSDGAHVPLVVEMRHPMETDHYIKTIEVLNETDPIPSKGVFHLSPANGRPYFSVQARMNSGTSTVLAVAECTRHGRWMAKQSITIAEGGGGCGTAAEGEDHESSDDAIGQPGIRIPELVERGAIRRGEIIRAQMKLKHPSRTGLTLQGGRFVQTTDPFYPKEMKVWYGDRLVSRYEMTPAISDNPLVTFTVRASEESTIRIVVTNSRGQQFEAAHEIRFA